MDYTFKIKQMTQVGEKVGELYDLELACYNNDLKTIIQLISIFGGISEEEAENEIDKELDNGKTIFNLYEEIFKGINTKGFFTQKLVASTEVPPSNMAKLTKELFDTVVANEMTKEAEKQLKSSITTGKKKHIDME